MKTPVNIIVLVVVLAIIAIVASILAINIYNRAASETPETDPVGKEEQIAAIFFLVFVPILTIIWVSVYEKIGK